MNPTTGQLETAGITLARFPMVQRPRPPCLPLQARIRQLRELAAQPGDHDHRLTRAAEVCNKAALIASDCGLPDLARALCWRQYEIFAQTRPLPAAATTLALQPVLNLPRQLIREGQGDDAYAMLEALYRAARERSDAMIDGRPVNLRHLTRTPDHHKTTCTLIWAALLADGTRALALSSRWDKAAERAAAHRGVGMRLLDGRQITILALAQNDEAARATALVDESTIIEHWEHTVQNLLRVICHHAARADTAPHIGPMLTAALALLEPPHPTTAVFHTRAGITALELAHNENDPQLPKLREKLIIAASNDAYAAQDVLAHPLLRLTMTTDQHRNLTDLVHASRLQAGTIPEPLNTDLMTAVSLAENQLRSRLRPR